MAEYVKFDGQYWFVDRVKNGMAVLYRNGQAAIVPISLVQQIRFLG